MASVPYHSANVRQASGAAMRGKVYPYAGLRIQDVYSGQIALITSINGPRIVITYLIEEYTRYWSLTLEPWDQWATLNGKLLKNGPDYDRK